MRNRYNPDNQSSGSSKKPSEQGSNPGSGSSKKPSEQESNPGLGSAENSSGQGSNPGLGSAENSSGQGSNPGLGSAGNSSGQGSNPGSGSAGSSSGQGSNPGFRFPGSSPEEQSGDRGSGSPNTARQNGSQDSGSAGDKNDRQRNGATGKKSPDRGQNNTSRNTTDQDRSTSQPENSLGNLADKKSSNQPPKTPPINAEQLTNLLRIAAVILMLVAGVAWYLWLQSRQEKIAKQKERKFNQLPTIERIYWLMLKELRTSGSIKHSNETEWEFALAKTQSTTIDELRYPGLLGKLITEISGDYVAWRYGKKAPNDTSLNHKLERFRQLHREFYAAEQAKRKAASSVISQVKRHVVL